VKFWEGAATEPNSTPTAAAYGAGYYLQVGSEQIDEVIEDVTLAPFACALVRCYREKITSYRKLNTAQDLTEDKKFATMHEALRLANSLFKRTQE
jgi:hypothetical protein